MAISEMKVLRVPLDQTDKFLAEQIAAGYQPLAAPVNVTGNPGMVLIAVYKGTIDWGSGSTTIDGISDASDIGKALLAAADAAAARQAIGAGTFTPDATKTTTLIGIDGGGATKYYPRGGVIDALVAAEDAAAARTAIGAGTSYTLPAATAAAIGGVKLAAVTALVASADAVAADGDAPTKAEFDAVVTLANELKTKVNGLINTSRAAGQAASA